jgi:hypothetical protein
MMDRRRLAWAAFVAGITFVVLPRLNAEKKKNQSPPFMEVQKVVDWVSNSLAKACTSDDDTAKICSTLSAVTLTLHTEIDKDGKIGVSIFGISLGSHREKDTYNEFSVTLKRPESAAALSAAEKLKLPEQLVMAFRNYLQIEKAAAAGQYPLTTSGFYVELGFTVQKGGDIDSSGLTLIPITPDIAGKVEKKDVQTIRFTFGK